AHADQQLMQCKPLWPERDKITHRKPREIVHLLDIAKGGERVVRTENRAQRPQLARNIRLKTRIPGAELWISNGSRGGHELRPGIVDRDHTGSARHPESNFESCNVRADVN